MHFLRIVPKKVSWWKWGWESNVCYFLVLHRRYSLQQQQILVTQESGLSDSTDKMPRRSRALQQLEVNRVSSQPLSLLFATLMINLFICWKYLYSSCASYWVIMTKPVAQKLVALKARQTKKKAYRALTLFVTLFITPSCIGTQVKTVTDIKRQRKSVVWNHMLFMLYSSVYPGKECCMSWQWR